MIYRLLSPKLPGAVLVPPSKQLCTSYEDLRIHFMQSKDLSWIFTETYGMQYKMFLDF
jgi:hypothetical protein